MYQLIVLLRTVFSDHCGHCIIGIN